ncbi:hypothetical protein FKM82_006639 [Ascaphus truei]
MAVTGSPSPAAASLPRALVPGSRWPVLALQAAFLVSFVTCNDAPPVPGDQLQVDKSWVPESCSRTVTEGDFVRYHYHGTFPGGSKFDSSYDRGSSNNVFVGKGQLIAGMDKALIGMCVNERRFVKIPPSLAYGSEGLSGVVPPDAVVHFDVLLLDIWNPEDTVQVETYHKPENCSRTVEVSDFIRYHYNGTLLDGTLFDSSHNRMQTYDTYVGIGWLIPGMDTGLLGMCVGEKRIITVPPFLAYGEDGDGKIPGSAVLVFDIHVIDFHNTGDSVNITSQFKPSNCTVLSKKGDYLKYHYNATLMDGTMLDSTHQYGKTYNIVLGSGQVVLGMDISLKDMCVGETRTVVIPPHLGYGEAGVEGEVPGSAVLVFDIELLELIPGLPDGYMFIWNGEVSLNLFEDIDTDKNKEVLLEEFSAYIYAQVEAGKGKLAPGFDSTKIIENMFKNQDRNKDGKITEEEFKLKEQEDREGHDEL